MATDATSNSQPLAELAAFLATAPRFEPPTLPRQPLAGSHAGRAAIPAAWMTAAKAMFETALDHTHSPFRQSDLQTLVGRAIASAPNADALERHWQAVVRAIENAKHLLVLVSPETMTRRIATKPEVTRAWAGHAHLMSLALDNLAAEVEKQLGKVPDDGALIDAQAVAKLLGCNVISIYRWCRDPNSKNYIPHVRVGRNLRFSREAVMTRGARNAAKSEAKKSPAPSKPRDKNNRVKSRPPTRRKGTRNVPGTGSRDW